MRGDTIPTRLVVPHLIEWLNRAGDKPRNNDEGYSSPMELLAQKAKVHPSLLGKLKNYTLEYDNLRFDVTDRLFCAMGDPLKYWLGDPELAALYSEKASAADGIEARGKKISEREREWNRQRMKEYKARKKAEAA